MIINIKSNNMKKLITSLFILISILSCDNSITKKAIKIEAELCMKGAIDEANNWLEILGDIGYDALISQQFPPPFNNIMSDTVSKDKMQSRINWMEEEFGKVKARDFYGAHVLINDKLLTYVPDKMKSFKQISPKRLGVDKINDLYKDQIAGTYVLLIYVSKPTKKERAEELIVMWLDKNNKWNFVDYYIDDEI
jgi:hypothetical protein